MTAIALAFSAGLLSILSPCVLPLLPIILGTAIGQHRWGPLALAAGLAISFTVLGLLIAVAGFALGLDAAIFRSAAAVVMVILGTVLVVPAWQVRLAVASGPIGGWADERFGGICGTGLGGQFATGLLLGAVWSPCVGPTLGAASRLASQGRDLVQVSATMAAFGLGAALPLAAMGLLSRATLLGLRERMLNAGDAGKKLLGFALLLIGLGVLTGADKWLETVLVNASPTWLTDLTTRF